MTNAMLAHGITVEHSPDGTTYTAVSEPLGFAVPDVSVDYVEVTNLNSPNKYREYIEGLKDAGEIEFEANFVKADFDAIKALEGSASHWRVTIPNQMVIEYEALASISIASKAAADALTMTTKLRTTGEPTMTAA